MHLPSRLLIALALTSGFVLPAQADKTCLVKKFRYTNDGGYVAKNFTIRNVNAKDKRGGQLSYLDSKTWTLKEQNGIVEGREIWLEYVIASGVNEFQSCRKDGTKLVFDSEKGNTWEYKSYGTTSDGNRCRFASNECIEK